MSDEKIKILAVIPARGGSKGLPRKNLAALGGKTLVGRAVESAMAVPLIDRVVVSTDDEEIARAAARCGGEILMRPGDISGDSASSESALLHAIEMLEREGWSPDILVFLQCTSPLTTPGDIEGTIRELIEKKADCSFAAAPFTHFLWERTDNGGMVGINHDMHVRLRRQELASQFLEAGSVYVMRVPGFKVSKHRFFGRVVVHHIDGERLLEIDSPTDLERARCMLSVQQKEKSRLSIPDDLSGVIFDFDGVFTDNRVRVSQDGKEAVTCHRGDGMGIALLQEKGIPVVVISKEKNPVVAARCEKLKLPCFNGVDDKLSILMHWAREKGVDLEKAIFLGNDVNDIPCLQVVGCPVVVADAHPSVIPLASIVLEKAGGFGAVRELVDLILGNYGG